jgi:RNA polymerase sigma-70 factor (ECF subfamily)
VFSIVLNRARTRIARESRTVGLPSIMTGTPADEPAVPASAFVADGHWAESPGLWDEISPERVIAGRQLWDYVLEAIEALPAGQKAVITLRDIEARDADTVCALLDVSAENQRVLLHRARSRVRAVIDRLQRAPTRGGGSGGTTRRGASLARLIAAGMRARARVWARVWARAWVIGFPALRQA